MCVVNVVGRGQAETKVLQWRATQIVVDEELGGIVCQTQNAVTLQAQPGHDRAVLVNDHETAIGQAEQDKGVVGCPCGAGDCGLLKYPQTK